MNIGWRIWLSVLVVLGLAGEGLGWLLVAQGAPAAGAALYWTARLLGTGWLIYGLIRWRDVRWVRRIGRLVIGSWVAGMLALICLALDADGWAIAFIGIWAMTAGFMLGLVIIRLLLSAGHPILGVARTLVDEAIRMKVALVFIIAVLLIIPVLPLAMDPDGLLNYRLKSFLTWSMTAMGVLLSLMTIFLAVGTISSEFRNRQIFLTLTKPVSRLNYLLGKWLGIAMLNLLLVGVSGGGIYVFTQMITQDRPLDEADGRAVYEQVLVAREAQSPLPLSNDMIQQRFAQRLERLRRDLPETYGQPGTPHEQTDPTVRQTVQQEVLMQWMSIAPHNSETYVFQNLQPDPERVRYVQLRLKPEAASPPPNGQVHFHMRLNERPLLNIPMLADGVYHVVELPIEAIDEHGELRIEIINVRPDGREQSSISFNTADGLMLLYVVDSFEVNMLRSMAMIWIRLCFLAMLGLAAGAYLGFPTATLLSVIVYIAAASSGYLSESLQYYAAAPQDAMSTFEKIMWVPQSVMGALGEGEVWGAMKIIIRLIGEGVLLMVPSLGEYNPTPLLADGLAVSWGRLLSAAGWVGVAWTGMMGLIAWLVFSRREPAQVTV